MDSPSLIRTPTLLHPSRLAPPSPSAPAPLPIGIDSPPLQHRLPPPVGTDSPSSVGTNSSLPSGIGSPPSVGTDSPSPLAQTPFHLSRPAPPSPPAPTSPLRLASIPFPHWHRFPATQHQLLLAPLAPPRRPRSPLGPRLPLALPFPPTASPASSPLRPFGNRLPSPPLSGTGLPDSRLPLPSISPYWADQRPSVRL